MQVKAAIALGSDSLLLHQREEGHETVARQCLDKEAFVSHMSTHFRSF